MNDWRILILRGIIVISMLFLISGCKTTYTEVIIEDTIVMNTEHIHYDNQCICDTMIVTEYRDTFYLKMPR